MCDQGPLKLIISRHWNEACAGSNKTKLVLNCASAFSFLQQYILWTSSQLWFNVFDAVGSHCVYVYQSMMHLVCLSHVKYRKLGLHLWCTN